MTYSFRKLLILVACFAFGSMVNAQLPNEKFGKPSSMEWEFNGWGDAVNADANYHRHPLWLAKHETGYAGHLAVWYESEMEAIAAWLSEHLHECAVVLCRRHLDMAHPHLLRPHILHHHHWHPIRKDAL